MKQIDPSFWHLFAGEFIGTAILIIFGCGVVANVVLNKTKGNNGGVIVIAFGWGMAVFMGVTVSTALDGPGHLNPAVTLSTIITGSNVDDGWLITWIAAQFAGAILGSFVVYVAYKQHFDETEDQNSKLGVFATAPAIRNPVWNLATEIVGTFVLVFGATFLSNKNMSYDNIASFSAVPVGLLILAIGLSLGGPTGYAINPARDLGPRIAHFILPIKNKRDSDWSYSWIPVIGPIIGALLAALVLKEFIHI